MAWIWIAITIFGDIFRRHDLSGWGKAAWVVLIIVVPFLGVSDLSDRSARGHARAQREAGGDSESGVRQYVREAAGGSAAEIGKAKELLDAGTITQAEFDAIKAKAVS